tara:strand:- start:3213 stop:4346 length:1134 start_codon:yes stop_codon:yes gene_type:complete
MTFPSDTYFKNGVNIYVFIGLMQRNFILTDVMKTGQHQELHQFINLHSIEDQTFDLEYEYYRLHNYDLDSYDRRFAIIDVRHDNLRLKGNKEFGNELEKRCKLLHSQGFKFICASTWESKDNLSQMELWPTLEMEHIKWTGDASWFWFYMYNKHKDNKFNFTHDHNGSYWHKKHDFLYLNKAIRDHRLKLYNRLQESDLLANSIYTFWSFDNPIRLDKKYELPGIDPKDYPRFGKDQDITELPYIDTVCSIVSETNDNDYEVFMTEKIWKPIMAQHVFVVHGNYLYLQKLKEMGFKTFNNYFDESYDLEQDPNKRIDKIVSLCADLKQKNWQDIYLQTKALRQHNYDTMFDKEKLSLEINKTINLFLEFADSGQVSS